MREARLKILHNEFIYITFWKMKSNRDTKKSNVCFQGLGVVNEFKYERA